MSEPDLDDASALQAQLKDDDVDVEDAAFTTAQRQEIGSAIARLMGSTALVQVRTRHTGQNHFYMFEYLTEAWWNVILSAKTSHKQCQHEIIDRGLQICLRYPQPMCIVQMNALIQKAQKKEYVGTVSYKQQQEFKELWAKKKEPHAHRLIHRENFPSQKGVHVEVPACLHCCCAARAVQA